VKLIAQLRFDAAPEAVFDMLTDSQFQARKCHANGSLSYEVDIVDHTNGGATITTLRNLPTDKAPEYVRNLVGKTLAVHEVDDWGPPAQDGSRRGTIDVRIKGSPVHVRGILTLGPDGAGAVEAIDAKVKASVPFLGGRIERAVEPVIQAALRVEQREGNAWLAAT
jgi:hypothetical protein